MGYQDIRLPGGAATIPQYLAAGSAYELHGAVSSTLLGAGGSPFAGLDLPALGYGSVRCTPGERAVFEVIARG